jgi:hypothetical protein
MPSGLYADNVPNQFTGMLNPAPQPLLVKGDDREFLLRMARAVLGNSPVAATTAAGIERHGIDARRVNMLIPWLSVSVQLDGIVIKKVEADDDTPGNFGLFIRQRPDSLPPAIGRTP